MPCYIMHFNLPVIKTKTLMIRIDLEKGLVVSSSRPKGGGGVKSEPTPPEGSKLHNTSSDVWIYFRSAK